MKLYKKDEWVTVETLETGLRCRLPLQTIEFWVTGTALHLEHYRAIHEPQIQAQHRVFRSRDEAIEAGRAFLRACLKQGWYRANGDL